MTFAYSQIELFVDSEDKVLTLIIEHPDFFYTVLNDINDHDRRRNQDFLLYRATQN